MYKKINSKGTYSPDGALIDPGNRVVIADSVTTALNVTAATTLKATPGLIATVSVVVAGSAAGSVNDCATTGTVAAANLLALIPAVVGIYKINFPALTGITISPGPGQTLAVSYS